MGFIIGPIILVYILVSFFISRLIYKISKREILSVVSFLILVSFPFWDIFVQSTIREVYISSGALESKIYAYPEKDENGMIESYQLETSNINYYLDDTIIEKIKNTYESSLKEKIKYLDFPFYINGDNKIFRFYLEDGNVVYKVFNNEKARFKQQWKIQQNKLFGLYTLRGQEVIDTKTNTLLAESFSIGFPDIKLFTYIRNNILLLISGNGNSMMNVYGINNHSNEIWLKLIWDKNIKNKGNK